MYIPRINLETDEGEIIDFMRHYNFATLVTARDDIPVATHLPFVIHRQDGIVVLTSHVAKANDQWKDLADRKALVIFSEPHAYVSPSHYDHPVNVPTWNYVSVHAYGDGRLLTEPRVAMAALERMIDAFEASYRAQWEGLPEEYRRNMLNGIAAFEVRVSELQAKKKLSQNRSETEQERIIAALSTSGDPNGRNIATLMQRERERL